MADNIKGIIVDIGGNTAPLDKALQGVNKTSRDLQTELRQVEKLLKLDPTNTDLLAQRQKLLAESVDSAREKLDKLKEAEKQVQQQFKEGKISEEHYRSFQREVAATEIKLKGLEDQAKGTGDNVEKAGNQTENAGDQAKKSGDKAKDGESGWSKLGSGLKKAGELAVKVVAALGAAAAAAGSALVGMSASAAQYADDILTTSTQTGIATDELQKYKYAAELVDVPLETLTKSMAKQIKSMKAAQDGTKLSVDAYKKLGVEVMNADGSLRDGQTVYWETIDALGKITNETERDALGMQLLGKSAQELNPLIEAGSEKMNELAKKAEEAGYVMSGDTLDAFGEFDDQMQFLKVGAEGAKNALGGVLLPILSTIAGEGVDLLGEFTSGVNEANGDISKIVDVVSDTLTKVIDKIMEYLPGLIDMGMKIINTLIQAIVDNLPVIIVAAVTIITSLVQGLVGALPQIVDGALQLMMALVRTLIENLPMIIKSAMEIILALATGITESLPELIPALVDTIIMIVETLIDNIDLLIDASIAIIMGLAEGLIEALPRLIEKVPTIIIKLVDAIIRNLPKLIEMGIMLIVELSKGMIKAIPQLVSTIPEIITGVINSFMNAIPEMVKVGKNIVAGIWDGIKSTTNWLWDKITGFAGDIVDGIKDKLKIKSPSQVLADEVGKYMAMGIGTGFEDEMKTVSINMAKSIPSQKRDYDTNMSNDVNKSTSYMGSGAAELTLVQPVYLDGKEITKTVSKIQYSNGRFRARGIGVVTA